MSSRWLRQEVFSEETVRASVRGGAYCAVGVRQKDEEQVGAEKEERETTQGL